MMGHWLIPSIVGIPAFLVYVTAGAALLALFGTIYVRLTSHHEISLIRDGNLAAAIGFGGGLIGFSLPLSRAIQQASSVPDLLVWALVALAVQFLAYLVAQRLLPGVSDRISAGDQAAGTLLAAISIACGLINAASMTV